MTQREKETKLHWGICTESLLMHANCVGEGGEIEARDPKKNGEVASQALLSPVRVIWLHMTPITGMINVGKRVGSALTNAQRDRNETDARRHRKKKKGRGLEPKTRNARCAQGNGSVLRDPQDLWGETGEQTKTRIHSAEMGHKPAPTVSRLVQRGDGGGRK